MKTVYTTPRRRGASAPPAVSPPRIPLAERSFPTDLLPARLAEVLLEAVDGQWETIEEIRLRAGRYAGITVGGRNLTVRILLTVAELAAILTHMCGGSLYAYSQSINQGYITLPRGIRVGVAGRAVCEDGRIIGVCEITGLCIRLPHRFGTMGGTVCRLLRRMAAEGGSPKGVLIYAPPGEGKTTLLRAVTAGMAGADGEPPLRTVVIDTRGELGFETDGQGLCLDILRGYPRDRGIEIATRTLSAQLIVCDEIGDVEEAMALISAHHGGVPLVATAHGGTCAELLHRTGIRLLHEAQLFGAYVGIRRDGRGDFTYHVTPHGDAEQTALGRRAMELSLGGGV
ncbi:MAG: hypothetical protein IKU90_00970 [Clostridia bacterium]|nr:hypothetical protein [Clostridia bacterium]